MLNLKAEQCATCIFRPGNLMDLRPGTVHEMTRACDVNDSHIVCHETIDDEAEDEWSLSEGRPMNDNEAICRGYYDTGRRSQLLRIAERMNQLQEV